MHIYINIYIYYNIYIYTCVCYIYVICIYRMYHIAVSKGASILMQLKSHRKRLETPTPLGIRPAPARLSGTPQKTQKKSGLQIHKFGNGNSNIHMSIHMHTREYAYYTCMITYSVKTEARPIANTRPAGSCNIFPLGIWNFGSDLQDGWQIEKLFGALSFSNLTRVSAFSLTPLPGIQASWILFNRFGLPHQILGPLHKRM